MLSHYHIILAVAAFIVDDKNRLLVVKKAPHEKVDGGLWTVPGGKVKPDEHIIHALKREIKEEINLNIGDYRWIGEDIFISANKYFHGEHFLCTVKQVIKVRLEKNLTDYRWIAKQEVDSFQFHPNIKKEIVSIFSSV